jgi:mannose-1-phosphate guanylyltransferase
MAVFTADHLIAPDDAFRALVEQAFDVVEAQPHLLLTFGVTPTAAATGYGYLELAEPLAGGAALRVRQFREKPDAATAETFLAAGPTCYLWNSGMFVWRCATLLDCIRRFEPETHAGLSAIAAAWDTPRRTEVLADIYPTLRKISIDFAVMEPASRDEQVGVAAVPMALDWLDVGSWPTLARALGADDQGNTVVAERAILLDSRDTLVASSDPTHLVTTIGLEGIIVIHTPEATLVCSAAHAEAIKELHRRVGEQFGLELL